MNIAMLTTWNSACGIAEYSRHLVNEWDKMGHNILLLTNKPETGLYAHPRLVVAPVFGVHWWGEDSNFYFEKAWDAMNEFERKFGSIDILYIQYQSSLYEVHGFNRFLSGVKIKIIMTQHDSSLNARHHFDLASTIIVHNQNLIGHYIPFPTIDTIPSVFSFGMGRNDYEFIGKVCNELGIKFTGYDARKQGWLDENLLFVAMKNADAIVLWYNDVNIKGQSAALRTAISSHRPVIVNDIGWFADAPWFVIKAADKAKLQSALNYVLHLDYIEQNSYKHCAEKYMEVINESKKA
jgi:hypothetical protein